MKKIESKENKIIKKIQGLQLKKNRDKENLFLVEGFRFVNDIPKNYQISAYVLSQTFCQQYDTTAYESRATTYIVDDALFQAISDTQNPQGILAICEKKETSLQTLLSQNIENPFFIVAEELNDPGNLGTIIRTADACGANGILLSKGSVDIYNPKVLRATMGSFFHIPILHSLELSEIFAFLKEKQIPLYATDLTANQYPYALPLEKSCAFLIGNEARGISEMSKTACHTHIKLPMMGQAESLNASVATAVLLYEVVRQRITE